MFIYENKVSKEVEITRPDFQHYLLLDRAFGGTAYGLNAAKRFIHQAFMLNNKEFREIFMHLAAKELTDMEVLADLIHKMHGVDDRYYDEDNDDTPAFGTIPPCKEEAKAQESGKTSHINNDLTAALIHDLEIETKVFHLYKELYEKIQDEGARNALQYLSKSKEETILTLKDMLNKLTQGQEVKDFGLGDSHNAWDLCGGNYFDKLNPVFTNPDEIPSLHDKKDHKS
ncbi:MAG: manganese catalase family protein [Erysipelotrichaceae bacterium]|nr:manganese catalase family protein [Erysipelotrichaceae bacterium]